MADPVENERESEKLRLVAGVGSVLVIAALILAPIAIGSSDTEQGSDYLAADALA